QAEDGIRDRNVTGVQTCALPISWNHAVSKERLSPSARADLTQYSQLVRKLGKGTGKYAAQQRAEIREALDRCRPSVPVWIMPIRSEERRVGKEWRSRVWWEPSET